MAELNDMTSVSGPLDKAQINQWDEMDLEVLTPDLSRRFVAGEQLMLAQIFLKIGTVVPRHQHTNEQFTWVLEGQLRFQLGDPDGEHKVIDVGAGQVLQIPGGLPHSATALEETYEVDVFSPPRQDWIDGTDSYFRR